MKKLLKIIKKLLLKIWIQICKFIPIIPKKKINEYRNIHEGERVFIVATGPSLTLEDINLIKTEKSISMNGIIDVFDKTEYRPTYYLIQDAAVIKKRANSINKSDLDRVFVGLGNSYFTKMNVSKRIAKKINKKKIFYNLNTNYHIFEMYYHEDAIKMRFPDDFGREAFDGCTVAYSCIQMAIYMGFKEVYLLGCDCTYGGYFNQSSPLESIVKPVYFKAYEEAKEYANNHGVRIINCTRGGMLEVFERKALEDVVNGK